MLQKRMMMMTLGRVLLDDMHLAFQVKMRRHFTPRHISLLAMRRMLRAPLRAVYAAPRARCKYAFFTFRGRGAARSAGAICCER